MKLTTVDELLDLPAQTIPAAVEAKIIRLYERKKTKATDTKPSGGTQQKGLLGSLTTKETIEVCFWDCPLIAAPVDSRIQLTCASGRRGLSGLKRMDNDWKDKITKQLFVYEKAAIAFPDGEVAQSEPKTAPAPAKKAPATQISKPAQKADEQAPATNASYMDTRIHWGKNRGLTLAELTPQQIHWYIVEWMPKKEVIGTTSVEDLALINALKDYQHNRSQGYGAAVEKTAQEQPDPKLAPVSSSDHYDAAYDSVVQQANLAAVCIDVCARVIVPQWETTHGVPMSAEQISSFTMNLLISAQRNNAHRAMSPEIIGVIPAPEPTVKGE